MHAFEHQDSEQTLREGIAEYHEKNPQLRDARAMSSAAQEFFRCHDAAHVVFGCGNSLDDEAVVKIASLFGTTAGFGVLAGYRLHESRAIYRELSVLETARTIVRATVLVPRTIYRCARQPSRWPWADFDAQLSRPLWELRRELGIRVARAGTGP